MPLESKGEKIRINLVYTKGSLSFDHANRLKQVDKENTPLRKLVANLSLDKAILKEVTEGKY